uniref:Uncharacterized protein n=1 Tax=Rhizophora mucronata TaxID=61149 RepID=A0A2P2NND1_RHIMU
MTLRLNCIVAPVLSEDHYCLSNSHKNSQITEIISAHSE